ncbi:hypothetical protein HPP92_006662 [Vanilla planifolia]|uniref:XPG N-terminal domain-containing protein n=1 Tax=Vanilla planifolia TaxID=51239 RepID=A0A835RET4_VANPL|nr:hypothetical protein HPP92_006662 [Vanilla planifolia]
MGVQGLWELVAPVGRRVSVETLAGKKLAIDASIWMIQFMKAMRDERGEMVRNAHLLGFFRRICKLLFLRTKPVFVFDGGTPSLKRRTVTARRRHRDNARAKIRKTAEKLLLNHLKSKRLEELAEEVKRCKSGAEVESKGKQVASSGDNVTDILKESGGVVDRTITHESLDQMLAASIAAEEEGKLRESDFMPSGDVSYEEEDGVDEDEQMIFHVNGGTIDPAVLASLPPSMQLDLLDQMRERLMADNRQKYQKFKKIPAKFSELQIQSYLKTVAFRREIDEVQKCAAGRGVGGIQTSRIASEANREYIFSSSFTGDKQMLTSTGVAKGDSVVNPEMEKTTALDTAKGKLFMSPSKSPDFSSGRTSTEFAPDVETYLDDRGKVRVSRVRGLGIRMTRDLQRNLDLMKEYEQLLGKKGSSKNPEIVFHSEASDFSKDYPENTSCIPSPCIFNEENNSCTNASITDDGTSEKLKNSLKSTTGSVSKAAIEICFTEDEIRTKNLVDNFFFNLVSGDPTSEFFPENMYFEKNGDCSESECIWDDGMVGEQDISVGVDDCKKPSFDQSRVSEDDEVEWEEGDVHAPHSVENEKSVSRGLLEEEANLQEAIRRSLEEIKVKHSSSVAHVEESTMALKDQSSLSPVKTNMDEELTLERVDSVAGCSRSNDGLIASDKQYFPSSFVLDGRQDGNAICTDVIISTVSRSDTGLLDELQSMEQSKNGHIENLCKVGSNLVADDAPKSKKTADHVVENGLYIDLGTANNRIGTSLGDCYNDSADSLPTVSLDTGPSVSFSSEARFGTDVSLSLIEKTEARIGALQGLAKNDNYNNPSDGLAFE